MSANRRKLLFLGILVAATAGAATGMLWLQPRAKATPKVETLLPANAIAYAGWDGRDAHKKAFEKTAAYEALYQTGLIEVIHKAFASAGEQVPPDQAEALALLKTLYQKVSGKGLSLAVAITADVGPPKPQVIIVLHEGADLEGRIARAVKKAAGRELNFQDQRISGRAVTRTTLPARGAPFDLEFGWWAEGKHLVIAAGADVISEAIAVADGRRPNITTNPLWKKYRTGKDDFEVSSVAWFDMGGLRKMFGEMPIPAPGVQPGLTVNRVLKSLGLHNVGAIVCRCGYRDRALWSRTTLEAPGEKTGLIGLAAQQQIGFSDLPPLPSQTNGFYACSLDWSKSFADVKTMIRNVAKLGPPQAAGQVEAVLDQIPAIIGFDPGKDLFDAMGNVSCVYADPGQGPFGIGAGAAIRVKNAKTLRSTFDDILQRIAISAEEKDFKVRRVKKHGRELIILEIARGVANPTFVIDDDWLVIGIYPQTVEAFLLRLDGKLPKWSPGPEYRQALADMPKKFTSIAVSDPRETYRMLMGLAPAAIPLINLGLREAGMKQGLNIPIADLPPTELVTRKLFPNVAVCTVDDAGIHWTSRSSLPSIPLLGGGNVATTGVLTGLLLPAIQQAREAARRAQSKNNLKQLGLGLHNYHEVHRHLPRGTVANANLKTNKRLSWIVSILPQIEQQALFRRIDQTLAWDAGRNMAATKTTLQILQNPQVDSDGKAVTHYVGIGGVGKGSASAALPSKKAGMFGYNRMTRFRDVTDGLSNTIMVSEASKNYGAWTAGGNATIRELVTKPYINGPDGIGSPFRGGCHMLLGDGAVRFVSEKIDPQVLEGLSTIQGGENIGGF